MARVKSKDIYTFYTNLYKEGENLAVLKERRFVYPVDLTDRADDLNTIAERLGVSKAEGIREAIRHYAEYLRGLEVVAYRKVNKEQAKREVEGYLKGKARVRADEISDTLRIDLSLINEVLLELWKEGWVEPERKD